MTQGATEGACASLNPTYRGTDYEEGGETLVEKAQKMTQKQIEHQLRKDLEPRDRPGAARGGR